MSDLYAVLKEIATTAVEASDPVKVVVGVVTNTKPISVSVEQRLELSEEFLLIPRRIKEEKVKKGDGLLMLREQGGQRYIVLDIM